MKKTLAAILALSIIPLCSFAGSGITYNEEVSGIGTATISWTNNTNTAIVASTKWLAGQLERIVVRASMGTNATFEMYLKDPDNVDLLSGLGAAVATNSVVNLYPGCGRTDGTAVTNIWPFAFNGVLTLTVTNFADTNATYTGSCKFYWLRR